eukprot:1901907-Rhodomonas_salina.1
MLKLPAIALANSRQNALHRERSLPGVHLIEGIWRLLTGTSTSLTWTVTGSESTHARLEPEGRVGYRDVPGALRLRFR